MIIRCDLCLRPATVELMCLSMGTRMRCCQEHAEDRLEMREDRAEWEPQGPKAYHVLQEIGK